MAVVWYATLEQVKAATDSKETARNNSQLSRAIAGATDSIETDQLRRRFYPELATRTFDWPAHADSRDGSRVLSLGRDEMASITELTVEGQAVDPAHYRPLYSEGQAAIVAVELDDTVTIAETGRRAIGITGPYGFTDDQLPAGLLAAAIPDLSVATVTVSDSAAIGTGQLLTVGSERMIVDRRSMVDTGQDLTVDVLSKDNARVVSVGDGSAFGEGEVVLVDAEKMWIDEIAGDDLIVRRAWDGTALAAHSSGAGLFAPRQLTVRRGVLGTAAATHTDGTEVTKLWIPDMVNQLAIAEAMTAVAQENSGYGRKIGAGEADRAAAGAGIEDIRTRAWQAYGRRAGW